MNVVIRTDASFQSGTGHVMRCLTLADALRARGDVVRFVCREHDGHLCERIESHGFIVARLKASPFCRSDQDSGHVAWLGVSWQRDAEETRQAIATARIGADWLVVDHYGIDQRWEKAIRGSVSRIMVIDDLADRPHDCDALLDQNHYVDGATRYNGLIPLPAMKLQGPQYALLRPEFTQARERLRHRNGTISRVLVFFGGGDSATGLQTTLEAFGTLARPLTVDVILGFAKTSRAISECYQGCEWVTFHREIANIAEMMVDADLFVGGAGTTTWERCCVGIPSIAISVARNQEAIALNCEKAGACLYLGRSHDVTPWIIARALERALADPEWVARMSACAVRLADGEGTQRVVSMLSQAAVARCL